MAYNQTKYIRVDKLIDILKDLPPHLEVEPNAVGNLSLYAGPSHWVGYIDLFREKAELDDGNA